MKENQENSSYWRSFEDYHRKESGESAPVVQEFIEGTFDEIDLDSMSKVNRRRFLSLIGASAALAGTACSDYRDNGEIVAYSKKPVEVTPGVPNYYASTCDGCEDSCGVLVKTREGRPIKIDGNPDDPVRKGKLCSKGHASIMTLYDPNRLKQPLVSNGAGGFDEIDWEAAAKKVQSKIKSASASGKKTVIFGPSGHSLLREKLVADLKSKFKGVEYIGFDYLAVEARDQAWMEAYEESQMPVVAWEKADVILSVGSDFLGRGSGKVENVRRYSSRRSSFDLSTMNRLYCVEGGMSVTGINADYRLRLRPDSYGEFLLALANEIVVGKKKGSFAGDARLKQKLAPYSLSAFVKTHGMDEKVVGHLVNDLIDESSQAFVHVGDRSSREVHLAGLLLNEAVGGQRVYERSQIAPSNRATSAQLQSMVSDMNAGKVGVFISWAQNPVYHLDGAFDFSSAYKKVPFKASLTLAEDESTRNCDLVLPMHHYLESWGDSYGRGGVHSLRQPVINPLFKSAQAEDFLFALVDGKYLRSRSHDELKGLWEDVYRKSGSSAGAAKYWYSSLHDGVVTSGMVPSSRSPFQLGSVMNLSISGADTSKFAVEIQESYNLGDGSYGSVGWLQEVPHPVSKMVWDNYAAVSTATAKELGVESNDKIEVTLGKDKLSLPVFVQPGMADKTVVVETGYGRQHSGPVSDGVGFNVNPLIQLSGSWGSWAFGGAQVKKFWGTYELVSTQEHWAFDEDVPEMLKKLTKDAHLRRKIIHEATLPYHKKDNNWLKDYNEKKRHHLESIYVEEHEYNGVKWGMAIDLNKCTGCMECVVACNSENNIPVVGKEQVQKNREMHWMRIDRYYAGTVDEPQVSVQPMLCQQCDNAPCENVCPVAATTHTPDGLNGMAYNRCVGTRYCANNCPYKVRRFNFHNYRRHFENSHYEAKVAELAHNPEVTVRSRGVMEKCTFCVQRIMDARSEAKIEKRELKGTDVTVACQDACNSNAIVFGDQNDKKGPLMPYLKHELEYKLLEELLVRPNVIYMAKIKNTHEEARS